MVAIPQETSVPSEWRRDADGSLSRQLKGFEIVINMIEFHQSGNVSHKKAAVETSTLTPGAPTPPL
jgi:hypothetical protein